MPYKLKANVENFEVVDGPFAGRNFVGGQIYEEIPPGEERRFEPATPGNSQAKAAKKSSENTKPEVTDA